jgi:hypothetical protein
MQHDRHAVLQAVISPGCRPVDLQPVQLDLTLDEAIAIACARHDVAPERLDSAWLSTPLARRAAAAERAARGADTEPEDPSLPPEFVEFDRVWEPNPDLPMWELRFGRMEYLDPEESAWRCAKVFRIVGKNIVRSLPSVGTNPFDPEELIEFHPAIPFGRALDLAANDLGVPRSMAHAAWYETARMIAFHEQHDTKIPSAPDVPHWRFEFDIVQALARDGFNSIPSATARVFEDGRVEARRFDWKRILGSVP